MDTSKSEPSGCCKSRRGCCSIIVFTINFSIAAAILEGLKSYTSSQITSLEKQFGLSSAEAGILISAGEIGFLAAILFVGHFGGKRHIPKILSCAVVIFALTVSVPGFLHFAHSTTLPRLDTTFLNNTNDNDTSVLCGQTKNKTDESCLENDSNSVSSGGHWTFILMAICMAILGMCKSPRFSLGLPFIDNNSRDKQQSSLLYAVVMTVSFCGPAVTLVLGGVVGGIPVDLSDTTLDPRHPQWIGAWWIGYLAIAGIALLAGLPLWFFPKHIKEVERMEKFAKPGSLCAEFADLPKSLVRLLKNPVMVCLLFGNCILMFAVGGFITFAPKYLEVQFEMSPSRANFIVGIEGLIFATIGTFLGGLLTSKLKLTNLGCIKMVLIVIIVANLCYVGALAFGCESPEIRGFGDSTYSRNWTSVSLCECSAEEYIPVCGTDKVTYFSPCFAGCTTRNGTVYSDCAGMPGATAKDGQCQRDCPFLYPFLTVDVLSGLAGTMSIVPNSITIVKVVDPRDKSLAVALLTFMTGVLAFLPSPIVYGKIIDSTCRMWSSHCGEVGACSIYDLESYRFRVRGTDVALFGACTIAYLGAYLFIRCGVVPNDDQQNPKKPEEKEMLKHNH